MREARLSLSYWRRHSLVMVINCHLVCDIVSPLNLEARLTMHGAAVQVVKDGRLKLLQSACCWCKKFCNHFRILPRRSGKVGLLYVPSSLIANAVPTSSLFFLLAVIVIVVSMECNRHCNRSEWWWRSVSLTVWLQLQAIHVTTWFMDGLSLRLRDTKLQERLK